MMMFIWLLICALNMLAAIMLAGTWQGTVSLVFVGVSLYYILTHDKTR